MRMSVFCEKLQIPFSEDFALTPRMREILTEVFGQEPELDPIRSVLRLVEVANAQSHVPFHQDMRAFGVIGANVWAPMTPAGGDNPGLELIPGRRPTLLPTLSTPGEYDHINIDLDRQDPPIDLATAVAPVLEPGDCILFLGDVVHRSYVPSGRTSERLSVEMRFSA